MHRLGQRLTAVAADDRSRTSTGHAATMRAIIQDNYGSTDALELREVARPVPGAGEVLVGGAGGRSGPGGVASHDRAALPDPPARLRAGAAQGPHPGMDLAGHIEAVGAKVTRFRPGEAVFGWTDTGAYAQYAAVPADHLALKPANLSFAQAAAVPISGVAALQGLRDVGGLQAGQRVLILGAAGGVGSFAVQLAKAVGAEVTGVAHTTQAELVGALGADQVIDSTRQELSDDRRRWDLILPPGPGPPAIQHLLEGHRHGKLVITI
jgi:NADPH:quinone reductase-like Zn-dependent oxidoreductase